MGIMQNEEEARKTVNFRIDEVDGSLRNTTTKEESTNSVKYFKILME